MNTRRSGRRAKTAASEFVKNVISGKDWEEVLMMSRTTRSASPASSSVHAGSRSPRSTSPRAPSPASAKNKPATATKGKTKPTVVIGKVSKSHKKKASVPTSNIKDSAVRGIVAKTSKHNTRASPGKLLTPDPDNNTKVLSGTRSGKKITAVVSMKETVKEEPMDEVEGLSKEKIPPKDKSEGFSKGKMTNIKPKGKSSSIPKPTVRNATETSKSTLETDKSLDKLKKVDETKEEIVNDVETKVSQLAANSEHLIEPLKSSKQMSKDMGTDNRPSGSETVSLKLTIGDNDQEHVPSLAREKSVSQEKEVNKMQDIPEQDGEKAVHVGRKKRDSESHRERRHRDSESASPDGPRKKRPSILDGMKLSSKLALSPPSQPLKAAGSSPPVHVAPLPQPVPLRERTVGDQERTSPLPYPCDSDVAQNSFFNMFGLVKKSEIKVQDSSKRFHRETGGKLRRVLKPRKHEGMIYDKVMLAKGFIIESVMDSSDSDEGQRSQGPRSSSPRVAQKHSIIEKEGSKERHLSAKVSDTYRKHCNKIPMVGLVSPEKSPPPRILTQMLQARPKTASVYKAQAVPSSHNERLKLQPSKKALSTEGPSDRGKDGKTSPKKDVSSHKGGLAGSKLGSLLASKQGSVPGSKAVQSKKGRPKKVEKIHLAPPPPPRKEVCDGSRRSMRQRSSKRKEWWHLLRANPDEYEVDEEWEDEQEKMEEKRLKRIEKEEELQREKEAQEMSRMVEIEIKSEPESEDSSSSSSSSSSEDDEDVLRKLSGLSPKRKSKKKDKKKSADEKEKIGEDEKKIKTRRPPGPLSQAARVEALTKTGSDIKQYAAMYDEVIGFTPQSKRKAKDWAFAKKVLERAHEKGIVTCQIKKEPSESNSEPEPLPEPTPSTSNSEPSVSKSPPKNMKTSPTKVSKELAKKVADIEPGKRKAETEMGPPAPLKKKKKKKVDKPPTSATEVPKEKQILPKLAPKEPAKTVQIDIVPEPEELAKDTHVSPPKARPLSPVKEFSNLVTAQDQLARDLMCLTPHMCNVCWTNDHMYCRNMKRVAKDLPPCGGCLHYSACEHYLRVKQGTRQELKEMYFGIKPVRQPSENPEGKEKVVMGYKQKHTTRKAMGYTMMDSVTAEDLYCHEEMIEDSDSDMPHSETPEGTELLGLQLRVRARQITKSLGVEKLPKYDPKVTPSVEDDSVVVVEDEEVAVSGFGAECFIETGVDENYPPNMVFNQPVVDRPVFSGIIHPPGAYDEMDKVRIKVLPYSGGQFKMDDLEIVGKHRVVKVKVQRIDEDRVILTQTPEETEGGERSISVVREIMLPLGTDGQDINSEELGRILAEEAVKLVKKEDPLQTGPSCYYTVGEGSSSDHTGEPQVHIDWSIETGSDDDNSCEPRKRKSKVLMKKDDYPKIDWSGQRVKINELTTGNKQGGSQKKDKLQTVKEALAEKRSIADKKSMQGKTTVKDDGSATLSFSTKDIRERKPELLDYITRAGLTKMIMDKLEKERASLLLMIKQAQEQRNCLKEDADQKKTMMQALLNERDKIREEIKIESAKVQEADKEANVMRKRKTMLIGNKLEVDDGLTLHKELVRVIDNMIANVPPCQKEKPPPEKLKKRSTTGPKNSQFVLVKIAPHMTGGTTQTIAVPVSAATIDSLKMMPRDKVKVQTVQTTSHGEQLLQLTLTSTNINAKPQRLQIKLNSTGKPSGFTVSSVEASHTQTTNSASMVTTPSVTPSAQGTVTTATTAARMSTSELGFRHLTTPGGISTTVPVPEMVAMATGASFTGMVTVPQAAQEICTEPPRATTVQTGFQTIASEATPAITTGSAGRSSEEGELVFGDSFQSVSMGTEVQQTVPMTMNVQQSVPPPTSVQQVPMTMASQQQIPFAMNLQQPVSIPMDIQQTVSTAMNAQKAITMAMNPQENVSLPINVQEPVSMAPSWEQEVPIDNSLQQSSLSGEESVPEQVQVALETSLLQDMNFEQPPMSLESSTTSDIPAPLLISEPVAMATTVCDDISMKVKEESAEQQFVGDGPKTETVTGRREDVKPLEEPGKSGSDSGSSTPIPVPFNLTHPMPGFISVPLFSVPRPKPKGPIMCAVPNVKQVVGMPGQHIPTPCGRPRTKAGGSASALAPSQTSQTTSQPRPILLSSRVSSTIKPGLPFLDVIQKSTGKVGAVDTKATVNPVSVCGQTGSMVVTPQTTLMVASGQEMYPSSQIYPAPKPSQNMPRIQPQAAVTIGTQQTTSSITPQMGVPSTVQSGFQPETPSGIGPKLAAIPVSLAHSLFGGMKLNLPSRIIGGQNVILLPVASASAGKVVLNPSALSVVQSGGQMSQPAMTFTQPAGSSVQTVASNMARTVSSIKPVARTKTNPRSLLGPSILQGAAHKPVVSISSVSLPCSIGGSTTSLAGSMSSAGVMTSEVDASQGMSSADLLQAAMDVCALESDLATGVGQSVSMLDSALGSGSCHGVSMLGSGVGEGHVQAVRTELLGDCSLPVSLSAMKDDSCDLFMDHGGRPQDAFSQELADSQVISSHPTDTEHTFF